MSSCAKGESSSTNQLTDSYGNKSERPSKKIDVDRFSAIQPLQETAAAAVGRTGAVDRSRQPSSSSSSSNRGGRLPDQTVSVVRQFVDKKEALIRSLSKADLESTAATSSDVKASLSDVRTTSAGKNSETTTNTRQTVIAIE